MPTAHASLACRSSSIATPTTESLDNPRYGVAVAQRAWCEPKHILNTLPLDAFMEYLSSEKPERPRFLAEHG